MGTNYYLHKPSTTKCNHCGHDPQIENNIIHIGKSSYGWCFALHIHPQLGINTFDDWKQLWNNPQNIIKNEYDEIILPDKMISTITTRSPGKWSPPGMEPQRHELDHQYCIGNGNESFDYMIGEFS